MKCPECRFVCSELRDICPKCYTDLRRFKRSVGLPVSNPDASYAQLAAKVKKKSSPSETVTGKSQKSKGLVGMLGSLWSKTPSVTRSEAPEVGTQETEPPKEVVPPKEPAQPQDTQATRTIELTDPLEQVIVDASRSAEAIRAKEGPLDLPDLELEGAKDQEELAPLLEESQPPEEMEPPEESQAASQNDEAPTPAPSQPTEEPSFAPIVEEPPEVPEPTPAEPKKLIPMSIEEFAAHFENREQQRATIATTEPKIPDPPKIEVTEEPETEPQTDTEPPEVIVKEPPPDPIPEIKTEPPPRPLSVEELIAMSETSEQSRGLTEEQNSAPSEEPAAPADLGLHAKAHGPKVIEFSEEDGDLASYIDAALEPEDVEILPGDTETRTPSFVITEKEIYDELKESGHEEDPEKALGGWIETPKAPPDTTPSTTPHSQPEPSEEGEVDRLFRLIGDVLSNQANDTSFELSTFDIETKDQSEQIAVLFDLALEEILAPGSTKRYRATASQPEKKVTPTRVSQAIREAPEVQAVSFRRKVSATTTPQPSARKLTVKPVPALLRLVAFAFDFVVVTALAIVVTFLLSHYTFSSSALKLFDTPEFASIIVIEELSVLVPVWLLLSLFYPLFSNLVLQRTIGTMITGLRLWGAAGDRARPMQRGLHALLMPITVIFFGFLPALFSRRTVSDYLTGLIVIRNRTLRA